MNQDRPKRRMGATFLLGAVTVLAAFVLGQGLMPTTARAQVPDSGAQRLEMIKELRESNKKLTEIAGLLREIRDGSVGDTKPVKPQPTPEKR